MKKNNFPWVSASEVGQAMYLMGAQARERRRSGSSRATSKADKRESEYMETIRREIALSEGSRKHEKYTQAMLSSMEVEGQNQNPLMRLIKLLGRMVGIRSSVMSS